MGIVSRTADVFYTYRFLRTLVTPWEETEAYEYGLIDKNGKFVRKAKTPEEKDAYTVYHRLAFNLKRILEKLPFGKSRLASYAAALFLLREHTGMNDEQLMDALEKADIDMTDMISESVKPWHVLEGDALSPGIYNLQQDIASDKTGDIIARKGTQVNVAEGTKPIGSVFGESIYKIRHVQTKQEIYVTAGDIDR